MSSFEATSGPSIPFILDQEDFGKNKDLKTLLKSLQSRAFIGKGDQGPNNLKEWIIGYNTIAQGSMD